MSVPVGASESRASEFRDIHVPRRVLIVDDDQTALEQLGTLLTAADYEIRRAADGEEALAMMGRYWFPVVITDSGMPVMNGLEFTQRLRALAVESTYVIMLTASDSNADYEVGYCAGVDHYLSKKLPPAVLMGRVQLAFHAIASRKLPRNRATLDHVVTVDLESGAHTPRHLVGRLNAEIKHSLRVKQRLSLLCIGIDASAAPGTGKPRPVSSEQMNAVLSAVQSAARPQIDWVVRLPGGQCAHRLAVILPQAGPTEESTVEQSIRNAFVTTHRGNAPYLTFGSFSIDAQASEANSPAAITSLDMLSLAERNRRGVPSVSTNSLDTVQRSDAENAAPVSIPSARETTEPQAVATEVVATVSAEAPASEPVQAVS
jgi:PleD family two-component response regulator